MLGTHNKSSDNIKWKSTTLEAMMFYWALVVIGSIALGLNSLFSFMFIAFRKKFLPKTNNKILLSMTMADSFVGVTCIVFAGALITKQPKEVYKLTGVIPLFGSMFISLFSLSVMTLDRLIAMKIPIRHKTIMSSNRVDRLVVLCWIIPAFVVIQEASIYMKFSWKKELKLRGYMLAIFFITGSIFLTISNMLLYRIICRHVRAMAVRFRGVRGLQSIRSYSSCCVEVMQKWQRELKQARSELKEIKAARLCIKIALVFIISWLPLTIYRFSYSVGNRIGIPWLRRLCLIMAILNSVVNPMMYLLSRRSYQKYIWRFLTCNYKSLRKPSYI